MLHTHAVRTGSTVGQAGRESEPSWIHLRSGGVSLLLQVPSTGLPVVRHWGADLGPLDGPELRPRSLTALPAAEATPYAIIPGCGGREGAGLVGSHDGQSTRPTFTEVQTRLVSRPELAPGLTEQGADTVVVTAECATSGLSLDLAIQLTAAGVVRCRAGLTNRAAERYRLDGLTPGAARRGERDPHRGAGCPAAAVGPAAAMAPWRCRRRSAGPARCVAAGRGRIPAGRGLAGARRLQRGGDPLGRGRPADGPTWAAANGSCPARSCSRAGRRTTRPGCCGPGATAWTRRRPGCTPSCRAAEPAPMPVIFDATGAGVRRARPGGHAAAGRVRRRGRGGDVPARSRTGAYAPGWTRSPTTRSAASRAPRTTWPGCWTGSAGSTSRSGWRSTWSGSTRSRRSPATTRSGCSRSSGTGRSSWCWTCRSARPWATSGSG